MNKKVDEFFRKFFGPLYTFVVKFPKTAIFTYLVLMFAIGFFCGRIETYTYKGFYSTVQTRYDELDKKYSTLKNEYYDYQKLMEPYEEQQRADAQRAEESKTAIATPTPKPKYNYAQDKSDSSLTGIMPKDYEPKGNEPDWIEILSYCEVQLPALMGYDASISLDENYTTIIRTDLRYKLETTRLKLKKDGSYHKATIIIEFEDDSYENYRVSDFVLNGVTIR